jgi:transposase
MKPSKAPYEKPCIIILGQMYESGVQHCSRLRQAIPLIGWPSTDCWWHAIPTRCTAGCAGMTKKVLLASWAIVTGEPIGGVFDDREEIVEQLQAGPQSSEAGVPGSRWTLQRIRSSLPGWKDLALSTVWKRLHARGIGWRRGRAQMYSPDPAYWQKETRLLQVLQDAGEDPSVQALFLDEMGYVSWPDPSAEWGPQAPAPIAVADRKQTSRRQRRVIGSLNATSGQVLFLEDGIIGRRGVCDFLCQIQVAYPDARKIYVIWDNWPVHAHQEVFDTLKLTRIELVFLPTYAPWLNPIEKLWRKFRQDILYLHRFADSWELFQQRVQAFFAQFASGSKDLLRSVGLSGNGKLASALRGH